MSNQVEIDVRGASGTRLGARRRGHGWRKPPAAFEAPGGRDHRRSIVLVLVLLWWITCFLIYATGQPIAYTHRNIGLVLAIFSGVCVAAVIGFRWGSGGQSSPPMLGRETKLPLVVTIGFIATLALVVPLSRAYSGFSVLEVGTALQDQGAAYQQATQRIDEGFSARSGIVLLQAALAPFTLVVLPYLALRWFEQRKYGIFLILALAAPLVQGLLVGRDQQTGLSIIVISGAWILSRVRRKLPLRRNEALVLTLVAFAGILAFSWRKGSRTGTSPVCVPGSDVCTLPYNNPGLFESAWVRLASYASQGFEGLGRAFDTTWAFGGGISHSQALQAMISGLLGTQPAPTVTTQLTRVEWSDSYYWSTSLTSLANDVPWLLVPIVLLLQAALLGLAWRKSVQTADWLSTAVFCYTFLAVLFMPQNLQLAISGPVYIGYITLVVMFLGRELISYRSLASRPRKIRSV